MQSLIPRDTLFGNPIKTNPQVSPDGTMLAYVAPLDGVLNVWVRSMAEEDDRPVTQDTGRGIQVFRWMGDNAHILYIQDLDGDENWHLYSVELAAGIVRDLTPFENVQVRIVAHNKYFPHSMLVAINKDDPGIHDVYHLDLPSGELRLVTKNPGNVWVWLADSQLRLRAAMVVNEEGGFDLLHRFTEDSPWERLLRWALEDARSSGPISFSRDGRMLLLTDSRNANTSRLVRIELATGALEVIAEDPEYDVGDVILNSDTMEPELVGFVRERTAWTVLSEDVREDYEAICALHHGELGVVCADDAERIWVVRFIADDGPVSFYSYDRSERRATFLFDSRPELRRHRLASMEPCSFSSRDGLAIHGYITFPPDAERRNLPMVLKVHGGPWVRDVWGYDAEAQWLANRGYICLQVNYRGSCGYGKRFLNAGDKEWGGRMQDDLVDAVQWAIGEGYADPSRVAIYGGSYGGYAALVGATFTPDLFTCAIDIVGPSNLLSFIEAIPPYWKPNLRQFQRRVGDPVTEAEFLRSRSPLFKVDHIRIPMLIAQGANDPRVKRSESEQIVEAMRSNGIPHRYLLFEDEGHGFVRPENRMRFYAEAERFLAEHLGGKYER